MMFAKLRNPQNKEVILTLPADKVKSQDSYSTTFEKVDGSSFPKNRLIRAHSMGLVSMWGLYNDGFTIMVPNKMIEWEY